MSDVKVSVCCLTYNHQPYIRQCLDGFVMQKCNFIFEVLIHDDASIDNTAKIIKEYEAKYPEIIKPIYQKENQHIKGIKPTISYNFPRCQGMYIALCEGDDYWTDPLKLQKQVDFLDRNDKFSGCFHSTFIKDEINKSDEKLWRTYTKNEFTIEDTLSQISLFHTSSFVFKRELLVMPKWLKKIVSGDMALFALIASKGSLYFIDEPMSVYRKNDGGVTNSLSHIKYHKSRIMLLGYLNKEFNFQYDTKITEIVNYHKNELKKKKRKGLSIFIKRILNKLK